MFPASPVKLVDCREHGAEAELFIVEGDSAALSVAQARDERFQAVLPMQGKPMNAMRATQSRVASNALFRALIAAIGSGWGDDFDPARDRYQRVLLLMDPDADGIHCGALMMMFFYRWMRPLLDAGRIEVVRAPVGEVLLQGAAAPRFAHSEAQFRALCEVPPGSAAPTFTALRYRGLAAINRPVLATTCLAPGSRVTNVVGAVDAEMALKVFGAGRTAD